MLSTTMTRFTLAAISFAALLTGCGDDGAGTSLSATGTTTGITSVTTDNSGSTSGQTTATPTTTGDQATFDPTNPDGSASGTGTGSSTGDSTVTDGTTGEPACHVTCQDVFNFSNFYDPKDYDVIVCEEYGDKALVFAEMVEMAVFSERFGALCKPFDPTLHKTALNVSDLAERTDAQELALRCIEFLGWSLMDVPPDLGQTVCLGDAKKVLTFLEDLGDYQTQHKIPDELLPNANIYQPVGHVEVGALEDFFLAEFKMGTDGGGTPPQKCRLRMDNITAWGTESFITGDKPFDTVMTYDIPNQKVIKQGYTRFVVECILTTEQIGWVFGTNPSLYDTMNVLGDRNHNLYDASALHKVVGP